HVLIPLYHTACAPTQPRDVPHKWEAIQEDSVREHRFRDMLTGLAEGVDLSDPHIEEMLTTAAELCRVDFVALNVLTGDLRSFRTVRGTTPVEVPLAVSFGAHCMRT